MKYLFPLVLSILSFTTHSLAQETRCGTMHYLQKQFDADPSLEHRMKVQEEELQQWIKANPRQALNKKSTITIPIVVHIIYSADSQNVSDERVHRQIAALNESFDGLSPHSMGAFDDSLKANTNIQFCLATKKPDGTPTSGIERRLTEVDGFQDNKVKFEDFGGLSAWDPTRYLNIWVCNYNYTDGTDYVFSAYAQFPGTGPNQTYGVVIRFGAFGLDDTTYFRGSGAILSHEIGHCFNLRHIWGDDGTQCSGSDFCDDTPNQAGRTEGKHYGALTDNCSPSAPGIMYMNYMDYSDDVIYANFTPDQSTRMRANFDATNGVLYQLSQSDVCGAIANHNELPLSELIEVYPNPVGHTLTLSADASLIGVEFRLHDVLGNEIYTGRISESSELIDMTDFSSGLYSLHIQGFNKAYKIIKS